MEPVKPAEPISHSPEPWAPGHYSGCCPTDANGIIVCQTSKPQDADRIRICVNFCAGIDLKTLPSLRNVMEISESRISDALRLAELADQRRSELEKLKSQNAEISALTDRWEKSASDLRERNQQLEASQNQLAAPWISVAERLPEDICECLGYHRHSRKTFIDKLTFRPERFDGRYEFTDGAEGDFFRVGEVTHWMPLPEPPKTGGEVAK